MNDPLGLFGEEDNTDPLGLFDQEKPKAGFGTAFKKALASAGNAMESAISLPAGALASYAGFQDQGDEIFRKMEANRAARNKWANPDNLETSLGQDVLGMAATFPAQIPAMLGQAGEKGMDLIQRGEPLSTAIPATLVDAGLNAAGMGPMKAASTVGGRAAIGALGNVALGAGSDAATQALSTKEDTKKAYDPYDPRRRFQDALVGGVTQGAFGERPKALKTPAKGSRALSALDALSEAKKVADEAAVKAPSEQLNLFDQFDERSPISPYQTEMAPDMWRVDENGIPIRADLSMELQNLQQPLQRNLFGDELDVNFPRDPNKPLDMATGDIPGVERFSDPVQFRNDPEGQIPLTEAIDQMPEGIRNRVDGKFAEGTTRQSALDLLRGEMEADAALEVSKMEADGPKLPLGSKARKEAFIASQKGQRGVMAPDVFLKDFPEFVSSKIKDASGQLKALFRGVQTDYDGPERPMMGTVGEGIYLTESTTLANNYATGKESGRHVKQAYVDIKQPFEIEMGSPEHRSLLLGDKASRKQFSDQVKAAGFDGVVVKNGDELKEVMAFRPEQVQNAFSTPSSRVPKKERGGVLFEFGKKSDTVTPKDLEDIQRQIDEVGRRYVAGELSHEEMMTSNRELIYKKAAMELKQLRGKEAVPATKVTDIFPGYKKIPNGTKVMAKSGLSYAEPTRGTVVGTKSFRYGEEAYNLPLVDFGDGRERAILPGDVLEVFGGPTAPFNSKKQSGGVLVDWKKKPELEQLTKIAGIKQKLGNLIPTKATPTEVIEASRGLPDVDQNVVQRGINNFTKGGLYQAEKTNNPVIKFTVDKVLEADRLARADVRDLIHDSLAPAMRALSTAEMTEIATVLNHADKIETPVTSDFLRAQGFSEKQIAFAEAHKTAMDASFESINTAREKAGLKPISKRAAYSAMNFTGDFRKLVYKVGEDGEKTVVGVLGAKTAFGLKALEKKIRATNPEYEIEAGKPRYMAGGGNDRGGSAVQAVQRALELLSENNGEVKQFLDVLDEIKTNEAYDFLGAKAHTKQKKGVFGAEGRKPWLSAEQNAKEFMDAQLQYAEAALRWGHLSNASNDIKQLLSSDLNMPNAKEWSESYLQNALGVNPSKTGRSFENAVNSIWEASGIGKTIPTNIQQYSRKAVNTVLLGLNPAFLSTNVVQPLLSMPAMASFLQSRGVDTFVTGYDSMAKAGFTLFKEMTDSLSPLEKEAQKYAKEKHVFGSDLVDTSSLSRKNAEFYLDKTGNFLASNVESSTRRMVYYTFVHMLDANGMGKEFGLAHNLTDMAMNNYSPVERPKVFNALGPIGDMAANLSSYKHNELSRLALFAREIGKEGNAAPFLTQIATSVAAAGITGALGFQEADWLYKQITKAMGAPDSLTRVVIDFSEGLSDDVKNKYVASHGVFAALGVDMSKRLGISDVIPNSLGEAAFPGGSKLVDIGAAGLSAVKDPSEMNLKRLAREASPGVVTGPMDRAWFSADTPQGELGLNRKTLEGQVIRTEADKMAKNLGFTGINESVMKQKLYDLEQQGIGYTELRTAVVKKMVDQMHSDGKVSPELIQNYMRYEGDPQQLETDLIGKVKKGKMSAIDAVKIKALAAKTIPQLYQGQRTLETFGESQ